ncbi:MAG: glycosyltransferase [Methylacidiphilales bacterium]|nr:glycosyltransferase [Candidatus Methylacidiphilales bacterium]
MDSPRYSVIIPMLYFREDEPALASLRDTPPPVGGIEILVAEGAQPSLQRNTAFERARGDIILFLDNDCTLAPNFWNELEGAFARPEVEIVGGPALLRANAGACEKIFHALLTHILIVGTISSRYASRGDFRPAAPTELILCNLAVRRSAFRKIGAFSSKLYPSEENEWLDRARALDAGIYYHPLVQVSRPQRATWRQMGKMLLRYGMGRTRQFQVSGWHPTFHQILPLLLVGAIFALIYWHLEIPFVVLWLAASVIVALTCDARLRWWQRLVAGLAAPLLPITFALGQIAGWAGLLFPAFTKDADIVVLNERGERIP